MKAAPSITAITVKGSIMLLRWFKCYIVCPVSRAYPVSLSQHFLNPSVVASVMIVYDPILHIDDVTPHHY